MVLESLEFLQPTPKYRELAILMELSRNPHNSQKRLASKVGLAPSMVNSYIKKIINRGFVRCSGENHKKLSYTLTEEGQKWKMELLTMFMNETILLYEAGKDEYRDKLESLVREGMDRVVLYGVNKVCELVMRSLTSMGAAILGVIDNDPGKQGKIFNGYEIKPPSGIKEMKPGSVIITSPGLSEELYESVKDLKDIGIKVIEL